MHKEVTDSLARRERNGKEREIDRHQEEAGVGGGGGGGGAALPLDVWRDSQNRRQRKKIPELKEQTPVAHPRKVRLHKPLTLNLPHVLSLPLLRFPRSIAGLTPARPYFTEAQTHAKARARVHTYTHIHTRMRAW